MGLSFVFETGFDICFPHDAEDGAVFNLAFGFELFDGSGNVFQFDCIADYDALPCVGQLDSVASSLADYAVVVEQESLSACGAEFLGTVYGLAAHGAAAGNPRGTFLHIYARFFWCVCHCFNPFLNTKTI
jgi:hypothetical protein